MVLGRRQLASDDVSCDEQVSSSPVDVARLEAKQLAQPHAGTEPGQHPGIPFRELLARNIEDVRGLGARERVDLWFGIVGLTKVLAHPQRWIRGQNFVLDRLREDGAERARDGTHRRNLQAFRAAIEHQLATVHAPQVADLPIPERRQNVLREMSVVERDRARLQRQLSVLQPRRRIRAQDFTVRAVAEIQLTTCELLANRLRDASGRLAITDPLCLAAPVVVHEDPPRALPVPDLDTHSDSPYRNPCMTSPTSASRSTGGRSTLNSDAHRS